MWYKLHGNHLSSAAHTRHYSRWQTRKCAQANWSEGLRSLPAGSPQGLTGSCMAQGFVYVVDCEGRTLQGWPLQMGEVQAQMAVGDINGDGALEVVAVDMHGNVAVLSPDGTELWERHIKSSVTQVAHAPLLLPVLSMTSAPCRARLPVRFMSALVLGKRHRAVAT